MEDDDNELLLTDEAPEQQEAPEGDEELNIELDGEPEEEPPLVKKLRAEIRDRDRRLSERASPPEQEIVVGDYPTLEACEYDEDKHREAVLAWNDRSRAADAQKTRRDQAERTQADEGRDLEVKYRASAAKLPVAPERFQEADTAVRAALSTPIQAALAKYTADPAKVVLALHKYPARLAAITDEPDPILQLFMIRDIEKELKVTTRKPAPAPESETIQRGTASLSATADKQLAALEREASRTGDRSALIAYKASKKKAA